VQLFRPNLRASAKFVVLIEVGSSPCESILRRVGKSANSDVMSVRKEQISSQWTDFHGI